MTFGRHWTCVGLVLSIGGPALHFVATAEFLFRELMILLTNNSSASVHHHSYVVHHHSYVMHGIITLLHIINCHGDVIFITSAIRQCPAYTSTSLPHKRATEREKKTWTLWKPVVRVYGCNSFVTYLRLNLDMLHLLPFLQPYLITHAGLPSGLRALNRFRLRGRGSVSPTPLLLLATWRSRS